jgi:hypothetical protein
MTLTKTEYNYVELSGAQCPIIAGTMMKVVEFQRRQTEGINFSGVIYAPQLSVSFANNCSSR